MTNEGGSNRVTDADQLDDDVIAAQVATDPDDCETTDADLAAARPFTEVFPELAAVMRKRIGRPPSTAPKIAVSLRLDADVVAKFRATGPGWQSRINAVLRDAEP